MVCAKIVAKRLALRRRHYPSLAKKGSDANHLDCQ